MKAQDFFTIVLKLAGLYLIKEVFFAIAPVFKVVGFMFTFSIESGIFSLLSALLQLFILGGFVYLLLFQTNWIIRKLQLTRELGTEPLPVNLHRSSVYTIVILAAGIVILALSIPEFIYEVYRWTEFLDARKKLYGPEFFDYTLMINSFISVMIGLLFIGNQRLIVNFIELKRRESGKEKQH